MYREWHKEYHSLDTIEIGNIGFVTYRTDGQNGFIHDIFISKKYRQHGWAAHLLALVHTKLVAQGITKVIFKVHDTNINNKPYVEMLAKKYGYSEFKFDTYNLFEVAL